MNYFLSENTESCSSERHKSANQVPEESLLFLATEFEKDAAEVMCGKDHNCPAENAVWDKLLTLLFFVIDVSSLTFIVS